MPRKIPPGIKKLPNGRYQAQFHPRGGGKREESTHDTLQEATDWKVARAADQQRGVYVARDRTTYADWMEAWLDDPSKTAKTKATDRALLTRHVLPTIGTMALNKINRLHVQRIVNAMTAKGLAPASTRRTYSALAASLRTAVASEVLAVSPAGDFIKLPKNLRVRPRTILTRAEIDRLAAELPDRYRPMLYLGVTFGMGIGELTGLRVGRLDLTAKIPTLTVAEVTGELAGVTFSKEPKNAHRERTLPLPAETVTMLELHLIERGLTAADTDALVFVTPTGRPIQAGNFRRRVWTPACVRAGIGEVRPHDLRRTAATLMCSRGVSLRDAIAIMGLADARMLMGVYAQQTEAGIQAGTASMADFLMAPVAPISDAYSDFAPIAEPPE